MICQHYNATYNSFCLTKINFIVILKTNYYVISTKLNSRQFLKLLAFISGNTKSAMCITLYLNLSDNIEVRY